jgi:hypothetical protein
VSNNNVFRPFQNNNIPILGQAFTIKTGFGTVLIECGCEAKSPVLIVGGAHATCPACGRIFACVEFTANNQTNQIQAKIGIARVEEPAGAAS